MVDNIIELLNVEYVPKHKKTIITLRSSNDLTYCNRIDTNGIGLYFGLENYILRSHITEEYKLYIGWDYFLINILNTEKFTLYSSSTEMIYVVHIDSQKEKIEDILDKHVRLHQEFENVKDEVKTDLYDAFNSTDQHLLSFTDVLSPDNIVYGSTVLKYIKESPSPRNNPL